MAAEDHRFFDHRGLSYRGIVRSLWVNILNRSFSQGASTITQQVVRLMYGDRSKNIMRKIKEQFFALMIESHCTKEQIMEAYLNTAYFGAGIYGVASAAKVFWGIHVSDITVSQAASLAAIVQRPEYYCLFKNPENCKKRRNVILSRMKKHNFITQLQEEEALQEECFLVNEKTYFSDALHIWLQVECEKCFPALKQFQNIESYESPVHYFLYTTLDADMQKKVSSVLDECKKRNLVQGCQGAVVVLDSQEGSIAAFAGSIDGSFSYYNRAFYAKRQMASLIKPLIFYYAFSHGDTPKSVYEDKKVFVDSWSPLNSTKDYKGDMTLERALILSNNTIPVQLLQKYGLDDFSRLLFLSGLTNKKLLHMSLALGCLEVTPLKVASYFRMFAHDGSYKPSYFLSKIIDRSGKVLYKFNSYSSVCLKQPYLQDIQKVLVDSGSYLSRYAWTPLKSTIMAKTGTATEFRTSWCVAATKAYTVCAYLGFDDNRSLVDYSVRAVTGAVPLCYKLLD